MAARPDLPTRAPSGGLSRVPYLPGLDGLRAVAVVGVMIYHANHKWLPGGFLGVEVFFVISGYLITMLLMGEHERSGTVNLGQFWHRRFRRLLPALYLSLALMALYITAFYAVVREQTRGDFVAALAYVTNWYQIFVGQGYAASEAFVPLRHLWSLAVEEQFYLIWPLVMVVVLRRVRGGLPKVGARLMAISLGITVVMGFVFAGGFVPLACTTENSNGYWHIFGRCISVNDALYLSTITRAGGLLLGSGFAMLWRPAAIMRGPLRHKQRALDLLAAIGMVALLLLMYFMYLFDQGYYNPWLFRGGFFVTGVVTLMIIAAVTHRSAATGRLLGNPVFLWIGTRSYGLYLFHWPIYEIIRKQAQIPLTVPKFVLAMIITVPITEMSYRFLETPIRKGHLREMVRRVRADPRKLIAATTFFALLGVSAVSMALADPHCVGAVACSLVDNSGGTDSSVPSTTAAPQTTVHPGSSTGPTTTTTTVPRVAAKYVAIGESVMLGAKPQLIRSGFTVNAKEKRGPNATLAVVSALKQFGTIGKGTQVVIQVGTNGPVTDAQFQAIIDAVPLDVKKIVFMTVHAPFGWTGPNNVKILGLPSKSPKVSVIDWDKESGNVTLCPDQTHVSCNLKAENFYANLILKEVGLPVLP
jgi:peptidoglycan/LPS O-acetylase OafA/YrhL